MGRLCAVTGAEVLEVKTSMHKVILDTLIVWSAVQSMKY